MTNQTGLYIHIPFCRQKCGYCDFYSVKLDRNIINEYLTALEKEIILYDNYPEIATVYIGGGNPACLTVDELNRVFSIVKKIKLINNYEFTIEANPEDVTDDFVENAINNCVNRISLGVQSFNSITLKTLGRKSNPDNVHNAINIIRKHKNLALSLDLIFSIPDQTFNDFKNDLSEAIKIKPEHLSFYSLILSDKTPLTNKVNKNIHPLPDEELFVEMYIYLQEKMNENGYNFYEVSNFSLPGFESKHNINYWQLGNYISFGAGASGFFGNYRYTNIDNIKKYIDLINKDKLPRKLNEKQTLNNTWLEYIMLSLRTFNGINIKKLNNYSTTNELKLKYKNFIVQMDLLKQNGFTQKTPTGYKCTIKGFLVLDKIILDVI